MDTSSLLPASDLVRVDYVCTTVDRIILVATTVQATAPSPDFKQIATRPHSRYVRTLATCPWNGVRVWLRLYTRRWFCDEPNCRRAVFTERLPGIAQRYARNTESLASFLLLLASALGGEAGARVAEKLGMPISPDSLLRRLRASAPGRIATPRVLGVDDFAFRRGTHYGTILIDLERGEPIDLLPDRRAETLAKWLKEHPGVEIVSRDRASAYAEGIRQGASSAEQVADRWHLLRNLVEAFEEVLEREQPKLREAGVTKQAEAAGACELTLPSEATEPASAPRRSRREEEQSAFSRERRRAIYDEVMRLHAEGVGNRDLARQLGLSRTTVKKYVEADGFPERQVRHTAPGQIAAFVPYLERRWEEGCHQAKQLWRELQAQGFAGGKSAVCRFITRRWGAIRKARSDALTKGRQPADPAKASPRKLVWQLLAPGETQTAETAAANRLALSVPEVATAVTLVTEFFTLVRSRTAETLECWLQEVEKSGLATLQSFARGVKKDWAAVVTGITSQWSNGPVEGHVNRLKLLKRQMYGRAKFALLRARVLSRLAYG